MEKKIMKSKKWYPVQYKNGYWNIQVIPTASNIEKLDVLSPVAMGKEQAEENARLCSLAPELLECCRNLYGALKGNKVHDYALSLIRMDAMTEFEKLEKNYGLKDL